MSKSILARRQGRRPAALLSVAAVSAAVVVSTAGGAGAAVTRGGGLTTDGIPAYFQDNRGIAVEPCSAGAVRCGGGFDPADATYFAVDAEVGPIRAAYSLTAGRAEALEVAQESRFSAAGLVPGRYTIKDPWGTVTCAAPGGDMDCRIPDRRITSFLRAANANAQFLGNPDAPRTVTGSPTGFNRIVISGPGGVRFSASRMGVTGQLRADTAMTTVDTAPLTLGGVTKTTASTATIPVTSFGSADAVFKVTKGGADPAAFQVRVPAPLASGSAGTIVVTYAPKADRNVSATLTIDDNGLAAPRTVRLTGVANDTRAPKVLSSRPERHSGGLAVGTTVRVTFNEPVRGANRGLSLVDASGDKVATRFSQGRKRNTYVLDPGHALDHRAQYTVKVNGGAKAVRDLAGNPAKDSRWSFRTR